MSLPTLAGHHQLADLVAAAGGSQFVAASLRIAVPLLEAYLRGELEPPYTVLLAVYWFGPYGASQAFSESHWAHEENSHRRREAEAKCERFRAFLAAAVGLGAVDADACMALADEHTIADAWPEAPQLLLRRPGAITSAARPVPVRTRQQLLRWQRMVRTTGAGRG